MLSQRERSLKGVFCAIDTACGMESVIQKLANSAPGSVNLLHDSWGNTAWVTKRLMVAALWALRAWKEGRRELVVVEPSIGWRWPWPHIYIPRLSVPDFVLQHQWREQNMEQRASYTVKYFSWLNCCKRWMATHWWHAICITYSATLKAEDSILPWHTGWVFLQSAPDHPLLPHVCPAAHLIVCAYMLGCVHVVKFPQMNIQALLSCN